MVDVHVAPLDTAAMDAARAELDRKTKPRGSLGRLEELAVRLAGIGVAEPRFVIVVAAADHGYADEGVSAYPAEVTGQMLRVFTSGDAAISVLARAVGADLVVADTGVLERFDDQRVRSLRIGAGTSNATRGPAMTREDAVRALEAGIQLARELSERYTVIALGDMGIANTTAASALHAALLGVPPVAVCGPGTGLDAEGVRRKVAVVERALAANAPFGDPVDVLAALGGFEIAVLAGVALGAAAEQLAIVLDGFIVAASALVASRLEPRVVDYMIAAHLSPEPGHRLSLETLGLRALLDLELRLGEGSGAALALPLIRASLAVLTEMATFESAQVTDAGR